MGYNTEFKGVLTFACEMTAPMLAKLNGYFGEDPRDHAEWEGGSDREIGYIDLVLTKDFSGIRWDDGTEKTRGLPKSVNIILREMRKEFPQFGLSGVLDAQGEEADDRWQLYIGDDGMAAARKVAVPGVKVTCPHCRRTFRHEESAANGRAEPR